MTAEYDVELMENISKEFLEKLDKNIYLLADKNYYYENIIELFVKEYTTNCLTLEYVLVVVNILNNLIEDRVIDSEKVINEIVIIKNNLENKGQTLLNQTNNKNKGFIYLMMNPSMSGIVKIGLTRRTPEDRLDELSKATGVPTPFILVYKEEFNDCVKAEKLIHIILEDRGERVADNREFFSTDISEAIKIIQEVKKSDSENLSSSFNDEIYDSHNEGSLSKIYLEKGIDYLNGYGEYLQDYDKAIEYLKKSGELGEAKAYFQLGQLYTDTMLDDEFSLNIKEAIKYYEKGRLLSGKYANYCNAGLAICYLDNSFDLYEVRNYKRNEANALKCWQWFFNNLNTNDSNIEANYLILACLQNFLTNSDCYKGYRDILEKDSYEKIKLYRYKLYDLVKDSRFSEKECNYLISLFGKQDLNRVIEIKNLSMNKANNDESCFFEVEIQRGELNNYDLLFICFNIDCVSRLIKTLKKDGKEVEMINEGETGIVEVSSLSEDLNGFVFDDMGISEVLGNDKIKMETTSDKVKVNISNNQTDNFESEDENKGFFGKVKKWFS